MDGHLTWVYTEEMEFLKRLLDYDFLLLFSQTSQHKCVVSMIPGGNRLLFFQYCFLYCYITLSTP